MKAYDFHDKQRSWQKRSSTWCIVMLTWKTGCLAAQGAAKEEHGPSWWGRRKTVDTGVGSCRLLCASDYLCSSEVWILLRKCNLWIKGSFMSRCARDMTKFVFSSSLSDSPSRKENIFVPKSNNSFSKLLELVAGSPLIFLQASGDIFIASVIRYVTFVRNPEWGVEQKLIWRRDQLKRVRSFVVDLSDVNIRFKLVQAYLHYSSNRLDLLLVLV